MKRPAIPILRNKPRYAAVARRRVTETGWSLRSVFIRLRRRRGSDIGSADLYGGRYDYNHCGFAAMKTARGAVLPKPVCHFAGKYETELPH